MSSHLKDLNTSKH